MLGGAATTLKTPHYKYNIIEEDGNHWCEVRLMLLACSSACVSAGEASSLHRSCDRRIGIQLLAL
jgi:hypothetical protein